MFKHFSYIGLVAILLHQLCSCSNSVSAEDCQKCSSEISVTYNEADSSYTLFKNGKTSLHYIKTTPLASGLSDYLPKENFTYPFILGAPLPKHGGSVRCTFDGSEPTYNTEVFSTDQIIYKTTVVRCTEFVDNEPKQKQTETYFIGESINMPTLSISMSPTFLNEYINASPCQPSPCYSAKFWEDVEYPAHVEYFEEGSSSNTKDFEIDAGISIFGQWSRNQQKKSVSIIIRKQYQKEKLLYPLFDTRPNNRKFKSFILRNNGQRFITDYIEDAVATSLLEGTNVDYQRSKQVIVFYNGIYHGIYDMREKLNEHFVETNYGISSDNVDMIKHTHTDISVTNGSDVSYRNLLQYVHDNDFSKNKDAYDSVSKIIDMANFMEYMAAQVYYQNIDWPQNNVRAWKTSNTPFKFIIYDTDQGFGRIAKGSTDYPPDNMLDWIIQGGRTDFSCAKTQNKNCFHNIFKKLIQNNTFKQSFINRAAYLYSTYINEEKIVNQINKINKTIDNCQILRDQETYDRPPPKNYCENHFDPNGDCLKKWSLERDKSVRDEFRESFDVGTDVSISIKINGNGSLKLDNFDVVQSDVYNWTVFKKNPITLSVSCNSETESVSWENGSTNSSRKIFPQNNAAYIATCK